VDSLVGVIMEEIIVISVHPKPCGAPSVAGVRLLLRPSDQACPRLVCCNIYVRSFFLP
jgi:hypothetical protein